jgi:plasmid stabilization system protein ParE
MPRSTFIDARFVDDARHISRYISDANPEAAVRFSEAVADALDLISKMPFVGPPFRSKEKKLSGMRKFVVPGFRNYSIYYRFREQNVVILRLVDGRRFVIQVLLEE